MVKYILGTAIKLKFSPKLKLNSAHNLQKTDVFSRYRKKVIA